MRRPRTRRPPRRAPGTRSRGPVPEIRPFRALRFDPTSVGDLGARRRAAVRRDRPGLQHQRLLARHPGNVVRLDLPARASPGTSPTTGTAARPGRSRPGAPTGRCARIRTPSIYVYEQAYRVPGTDVERTQRGFFARLRLEPFGPGERGPAARAHAGRAASEDRYRLLRATGVNTSPVVGLFEDPSRRATRRCSAHVAARPPDIDVRRRRRRPPSTVGRRRPTATATDAGAVDARLLAIARRAAR